MKKKLETVQIWSKKGLSDLSGETYFARRRALLNGISMINRLQFFKPEDEVAALQLIEILEQISRLKETLLAACRAAENFVLQRFVCLFCDKFFHVLRYP